MRLRRVPLGAIAVMLAVAGVGGVLASRQGPASARTLAHTSMLAALPAPAQGFAIPAPQGLTDVSGTTRWAPVLHATTARAGPDLAARAVVAVSRLTPEGTRNLVIAEGERVVRGVTWVRVSVAALPNGQVGWVARAALGGWSFVSTRVVVDRARLTLTLYRDGAVVFRAPVGIGAAATPTPAGTFYVRDRLSSFASPTYGPLAFGTSARSPTETDWPAGGFIGIHGTDQPGLIPGRISHGCVRLTNSAIERLGRLMPVGTPLVIR